MGSYRNMGLPASGAGRDWGSLKEKYRKMLTMQGYGGGCTVPHGLREFSEIHGRGRREGGWD